MSDLTRRVLAWDAADPDEYECFDPMPAMADAATILARQVEAVEALAATHETTARNMGSGSYGGALAAKIAQEIRDALNGGNT